MKLHCMCLIYSMLSYTFAVTLIDSYQVCKGVSREELEPCVLKLINDLGPLIREGIPELGLEPDTCDFETLDVEYHEGINQLEAHYHNGKVKGLEDFELTHLKVDYANMVAVWSALFPEVLNVGRYSMDAKVLNFPIYGNGTFWYRYENFHFYGVSKLEIVEINGEPRLQEKDTKITFSYTKAAMRMNNLYNGDIVLQAAANTFLDSNLDALLDEMRPSATNLFRSLTGNHVNRALGLIKLEDMAGSEFFNIDID